MKRTKKPELRNTGSILFLCREGTLPKNDKWEENLEKEKRTSADSYVSCRDCVMWKEKRENVIRITRISGHRALDEPPADATAYKTRSIRHSAEEYASFSPFCSQNESFKGN